MPNVYHFPPFSISLSLCVGASLDRSAIKAADARLLPVRHARLVECHKVDLTRRCTFGTAEEYLIVPFAEEFKTLRFLVHKHTV